MSMINEFVEKLIGRLEEESYEIQLDGAVVASTKTVIELPEVKKIVNQLAEEYNQENDDTDYANIELYAFWQKHQWIPVSERLPDEEGSYLVTFDDGYVSSAPFYDEDWELWCDSGEPVAWQPLPEPYKGE